MLLRPQRGLARCPTSCPSAQVGKLFVSTSSKPNRSQNYPWRALESSQAHRVASDRCLRVSEHFILLLSSILLWSILISQLHWFSGSTYQQSPIHSPVLWYQTRAGIEPAIAWMVFRATQIAYHYHWRQGQLWIATQNQKVAQAWSFESSQNYRSMDFYGRNKYGS